MQRAVVLFDGAYLYFVAKVLGKSNLLAGLNWAGHCPLIMMTNIES